jgi:type IV pilus assembly protein PilX
MRLTTKQCSRNRQRGAALITALVLLVILTMLGLSSMTTNTMEERMSSNAQEKNRAFQAAEAGIQIAMTNSDTFSLNHTISNPLTGTTNNFGSYGATVTYGAGFRQETPPRRNSGWDSNYSLFHFDVSSTANTASGATKTIHAGSYQVGRKRY